MNSSINFLRPVPPSLRTAIFNRWSLFCSISKISLLNTVYKLEFSCGPAIIPKGRDIQFTIICGIEHTYGLRMEKVESNSTYRSMKSREYYGSHQMKAHQCICNVHVF